jgi:hypothetical protein
MTNATHTRGPWDFDNYTDHVSYFSDGYSRKDDYAFRVEFPDDMPEPEAQANARLIAAAPDLLESAEKALSALQGNFDKYDNCEWHAADNRDAYIALRDAVSMAKGGRK